MDLLMTPDLYVNNNFGLAYSSARHADDAAYVLFSTYLMRSVENKRLVEVGANIDFVFSISAYSNQEFEVYSDLLSGLDTRSDSLSLNVYCDESFRGLKHSTAAIGIDYIINFDPLRCSLSDVTSILWMRGPINSVYVIE